MRASIHLGRIAGIEIDANWSVLFIFALVVWSLAAVVLPSVAPHQSTTVYWVTGLIGGIIFYGCLLAHELSHSIIARRNGVQVSAITLWLFGGVSQLSGEPRTAGIEALITVVGPLASILLAVAFFLLAVLAAAIGGLPLVVGLLSWLAILNLSLGVFNLIPAFPLDGGRLLDSFFWWRTGSRQRGLHDAVQVGRVFSFLFIGVGVLEFFTGQIFNGLWIAFIGWFLLSAAGAEETSTASLGLLEAVPVSAAMSAPVVTLADSMSVGEFLQSQAVHHPFTTYPLHDSTGALTGVVRLNQIMRAASRGDQATGLGALALPMSDIPTTSPNETLAALIQRLGSTLDRRVLVFDSGKLVGILSPSDVARIVTVRQAMASRSPVAA
jgi:Zn-dependent protease/predicted transcriptional regulator